MSEIRFVEMTERGRYVRTMDLESLPQQARVRVRALARDGWVFSHQSGASFGAEPKWIARRPMRGEGKGGLESTYQPEGNNWVTSLVEVIALAYGVRERERSKNDRA